jgi:signal transduction histidine kinase
MTEMPASVPNADGTRRAGHVDFVYQPVLGADGVPEGVLVFAYDVTEKVLARREVERLAKEREVLVHELSEAVRARDEFLQVASHELKTPLTPLTLQLETLARALGRAGIDDPRMKERVDTASRQIQRLTKLVESLLDVARITGGQLTLELDEFDMCEAVREVVDRFRDEAELIGSDLDVSTCACVIGRWDRMRIEQIVSNLVGNAIKYGSGRPIDVAVTQDEDHVRIRVADYGLGIAPDSLDRVFGRFERAVSIRHFGGLGLGLYIAQQIAEAHGGKIDAASELGRGSTFTVVLPRAVPDAAERVRAHHT